MLVLLYRETCEGYIYIYILSTIPSTKDDGNPEYKLKRMIISYWSVTSPVKYTGRPSSVALTGSNKLSYSPRIFSADHFDEEPCDHTQRNTS